MEMRQRRVTRIINAREVFVKDGKMTLQPIGFDMGSGYIQNGITLVEKKNDSPQYYSKYDSGACLFYENYFLGEADVKWQPKTTKPRRKKGFGYSCSYWKKERSTRISDMEEEGFILFLPNKRTSKEFFEKISKNVGKIREWINLWYKCESTAYCATYSIGESTFSKARNMEEQLDAIHDELIEKGLTMEDGTIINPQYIFILSQDKVKQACYNRSKPNLSRLRNRYKTVKILNIQWITPNVCVTDNEEDFFELMKECYGVTEIYK